MVSNNETARVGFRRNRFEAPNILVWRWVAAELEALIIRIDDVKIARMLREDRERVRIISRLGVVEDIVSVYDQN